MNDDDIEVIPILDDVVVPGQPEKTISGNIDLNDLGSIERFDGTERSSEDEDLDDPGDPVTIPDQDDTPYEEFIEENLTEVLTPAPAQQDLLLDRDASNDEPENTHQDNIAALDEATTGDRTPVVDTEPAKLDDAIPTSEPVTQTDLADDILIQQAVDRAVMRLVPVIESLLRDEIRSILTDTASEVGSDQDPD